MSRESRYLKKYSHDVICYDVNVVSLALDSWILYDDDDDDNDNQQWLKR